MNNVKGRPKLSRTLSDDSKNQINVAVNTATILLFEAQHLLIESYGKNDKDVLKLKSAITDLIRVKGNVDIRV